MRPWDWWEGEGLCRFRRPRTKVIESQWSVVSCRTCIIYMYDKLLVASTLSLTTLRWHSGTCRWHCNFYSPIHTADSDATQLSSRVGVGGVYVFAIHDCRWIWLIISKLNTAVWLRQFWSILITFPRIRMALGLLGPISSLVTNLNSSTVEWRRRCVLGIRISIEYASMSRLILRTCHEPRSHEILLCTGNIRLNIVWL